MAVTRTHFRFRIDVWTANGESIVGHVAGIEDYELVLGTFRAACEPWPGTRITLRQGTRVIEDSWRLRLATQWLPRADCGHATRRRYPHPYLPQISLEMQISLEIKRFQRAKRHTKCGCFSITCVQWLNC